MVLNLCWRSESSGEVLKIPMPKAPPRPISQTFGHRVFLGFPCGSTGKESTCNEGDLGSIPGLGRSLGEGNGCPLQYSGLENPMDYIVHGVTKSQTRLSDFHFQLSLGHRTRHWIFSTPQVIPMPIQVWEPTSPAVTLTPTQTPWARFHPWPRTSEIYPDSSHMPRSRISGYILPLTFQNLLFYNSCFNGGIFLCNALLVK